MSDGTEEETVEKSTDELLSETEDLLSGIEGADAPADGGGSASDGGADVSTDPESAGGTDDTLAGLEDAMGTSKRSDTQSSHASTDAATDPGTTTATGGTDERRFRQYFEPKSAGIASVLVLTGAILGGVVPIPFVGAVTKLLGVSGLTFLHGATANDSRYAETAVAAGVVGVGLAVLQHLVITISGVGLPIVALSTALTILAAVVGHYFGRDLRDGLTRDVGGGGGGGGGDDVPGW